MNQQSRAYSFLELEGVVAELQDLFKDKELFFLKYEDTRKAHPWLEALLSGIKDDMYVAVQRCGGVRVNLEKEISGLKLTISLPRGLVYQETSAQLIQWGASIPETYQFREEEDEYVLTSTQTPAEFQELLRKHYVPRKEPYDPAHEI